MAPPCCSQTFALSHKNFQTPTEVAMEVKCSYIDPLAQLFQQKEAVL